MNKYRCYLVIIALLAATVCLQPITNAQEENLDSPRLAALAKDIRAGKQDALTAFWEEMKGKAPLIEPVNGNDKMRWVSYIWRGDGATQRMGMIGGLPGGDFLIKPLARLGTTDLWYRTEQLPVDARFTYIYYWNEGLRVPELEAKQLPVRYDPFNISQAYAYTGKLWLRCRSEHFTTFEKCTERQLKMVSDEIRQQNRGFLKGRRLSAKALADFITAAEKVQSTLAYKRLMRQREQDAEVRPILRVVNGVSAEQAGELERPLPCQSPIEDSDHPAVGVSPFSAVDFSALGILEKLK